MGDFAAAVDQLGDAAAAEGARAGEHGREEDVASGGGGAEVGNLEVFEVVEGVGVAVAERVAEGGPEEGPELVAELLVGLAEAGELGVDGGGGGFGGEVGEVGAVLEGDGLGGCGGGGGGDDLGVDLVADLAGEVEEVRHGGGGGGGGVCNLEGLGGSVGKSVNKDLSVLVALVL